MTNKEIWLYLKARNNIDIESEFNVKSFTVTPTTITQGETVTLEAKINGGEADYTYLIKGNGNRILNTTTSEKTLTRTWKPANIGTYILELVVSDTGGKSVSKTITLNVQALNTDNSEETAETTYQQITTDIEEFQEQE